MHFSRALASSLLVPLCAMAFACHSPSSRLPSRADEGDEGDAGDKPVGGRVDGSDTAGKRDGSVDSEPGASAGSDPDDGGARFSVVVGSAPCKTDADCVPTSCCHPTQCGSPATAPDCSATMCSADCKAGTMTCGGGCLCQDGQCAARLLEGFGP